jgi:hypothetical protein
MDDGSTLSVGFTGPLICVVLAGLGLSATKDIEATATSSLSSSHTAGDSLVAFQNRMVEVGTWVFDHNGLRGEVDRGDVKWTFAGDGTMTITDSDETRSVTYSLTKHCGGYGKIAERDVAYLKVKSDGSLEDCYIIIDMYEVYPPEEKILGLMTSNGDNISLIPAN